ncbi:Factor of DNA methylation 1-5/IDN2 [Theobroma cacao]|nr:Factor of DNA methylation 1-5/IDN2 [Theobroma cacao]
MKGALQVMQHMEGDEETEMKTKMEAIKEELKKKEEELDDLKELNQDIIVKELVPFKIITNKEGNTKEILDEEDEKLSTLKIEFGD